MTHSRTRTRGLLATLMAGVLMAAAGCTSAVSQARQSPSGTAGGTLTLGALTDLQPSGIYSQSNTSMAVGRLLYDTLIHYDKKTGKPQPAVARSWNVSKDGRTVTLNLRDDVKYHSGRTLTSADVAYALKAYADNAKGSQLQPAAAAIASVDDSRPHVAVLHLKHSLVNLFDLLEFVLLTDRETPKELASGTKFVGTGPFEFKSWDRGQKVTLVRNKNYWNGAPKIDEVDLKVFNDQTALLNSVRSGQTDIVTDASVQALTPFRGNSKFTIQSEDVWDVNFYVGVNVRDKALSNQNLRQAISYAIDRQRILKEVFGGTGNVNSSPWSPDSPAYNKTYATRYTHDLTKAKALLAKAGGAPSKPLTLTYSTGTAPSKAVSEIVQSNLADIGINVKLVPLDASAYGERLDSGNTQLWIGPHGFGQNSPATLATGAAPFRPDTNRSGFRSAQYAKLVSDVWDQPDPDSAAAHKSYDAYTKELSDQQFVINLATTTFTNVYSSKVRGVDWNTYKYLILDKATVK